MEAAAPSSPSNYRAGIWQEVTRLASALSAALRDVVTTTPDRTSACRAYADVAEEIARMAVGGGNGPIGESVLQIRAASPEQLVEFGKLLRDRRNQAGLTRPQLARKAKLSDATIKFVETARHPPSRATLLRLIQVPELRLLWDDTPGGSTQPAPKDGPEDALATVLHRLDSRLTVPLIFDTLMVIDELWAGTEHVELGRQGTARRACNVCGMRSEAWAESVEEAHKLTIRHAEPCAARLISVLCSQYPVLSELALEARRSLRSDVARELQAIHRATRVQRFLGCRADRDVAAQLALAAELPRDGFRQGVSELWLWALGLGPCPREPVEDGFSERRACEIASTKKSAEDGGYLLGLSQAAAWLVYPSARNPCDREPIGQASDRITSQARGFRVEA